MGLPETGTCPGVRVGYGPGTGRMAVEWRILNKIQYGHMQCTWTCNAEPAWTILPFKAVNLTVWSMHVGGKVYSEAISSMDETVLIPSDRLLFIDLLPCIVLYTIPSPRSPLSSLLPPPCPSISPCSLSLVLASLAERTHTQTARIAETALVSAPTSHRSSNGDRRPGKTRRAKDDAGLAGIQDV